MAAIVVVTTVGTEEEAHLISQELIARRHAACVNIVPAVRSVYRWKGKICKDSELVLLVKSMEEEFEDIAATILELHRYELPEILAFKVSQGDERFLEWIAGSLDKQAEFFDEDEDEDEDEEELAFADPDD